MLIFDFHLEQKPNRSINLTSTIVASPQKKAFEIVFSPHLPLAPSPSDSSAAALAEARAAEGGYLALAAFSSMVLKKSFHIFVLSCMRVLPPEVFPDSFFFTSLPPR